MMLLWTILRRRRPQVDSLLGMKRVGGGEGEQTAVEERMSVVENSRGLKYSQAVTRAFKRCITRSVLCNVLAYSLWAGAAGALFRVGGGAGKDCIGTKTRSRTYARKKIMNNNQNRPAELRPTLRKENFLAFCANLGTGVDYLAAIVMYTSKRKIEACEGGPSQSHPYLTYA